MHAHGGVEEGDHGVGEIAAEFYEAAGRQTPAVDAPLEAEWEEIAAAVLTAEKPVVAPLRGECVSVLAVRCPILNSKTSAKCAQGPAFRARRSHSGRLSAGRFRH